MKKQVFAVRGAGGMPSSLGSTLLLAGASLPVLSLALLAIPASAQERPLPTVSRGYDGANAKAYLLFIPNEHAEEGGPGGDVLLNDVDVSGIDLATTIEIGSAGGQGGKGDDSGGSHEYGARGGFSGTVDVSIAQTLTGQGDQIVTSGGTTQANPAPRLWIYGRGGNGGYAQHNVGGGGGGGPASGTLSGLLTTDGIGFQGVRVSAIGGDAGGGGTDEDETLYRQGGFGGTVGLNILSTAVVKTSGQAATAAVVESLGGAGSVRGRGTFYSLPEVTRGGDAGAVYLTQAGQIATTGDYAIGALAQSVGGLGGQASLDGGGRDGAAGGAGGDVNVSSPGTIDTAGDYAFGLVAQSVGGNGGRGGVGNFAGGGRGGDASPGGRVAVDHAGTIRTRGEGATAIVAQSVSGGGAFAAFRADPSATVGAGGVGGATGPFSFFGGGGGGGSGSTGGEASVTHGGVIETGGSQAYGILSQSIGGGGGGGGSSEVLGIFYTVTAGGNGGAGGAGGLANVTTLNGARITTKGEDSAAVLAQSIGGGGGIGGSATAITVGSLISQATAIGGIGGSGGIAGDAWVRNAAALTTGGARAYGVQAMSIGGGGGTGGSSFAKAFSLTVDPEFPTLSIATAVGGQGGVGATSGNVEVVNNGSIATAGADAAAILAMSVGGGGGSGGLADVYNLALNAKDTLTISLDFAIGGRGAQGGAAGTVNVDNQRGLLTEGDQAMGIAAYSIGGGGGTGGGAEVRQQTLGKGYVVGANVAVGGNGGSGNTGGAVTVGNEGAIETAGFAASGVHALSVGGGGGAAGFGTVSLANGFDYFGYGKFIPTSSVKFTDKTFTLDVSVGGSGGDGGHGAAVGVTNTGSITTYRSDARGILAQSIGGGGGLGVAGKNDTNGTIQANFAVGGSGGAAGNGGGVTVANKAGASILTYGDGAFGIQAQSMGGGGGSGGSASSGSGDEFYVTLGKAVGGYAAKSFYYGLKNLITTLAQTGDGSPAKKAEFKYSASLNMTFGGTGGAAGEGGDILAINDGTIATYGVSASAVVAQSIGGGGGSGGASDVTAGKLLNFKMAVGGSGGAAGNGGAVTVRQSGTLSTNSTGAFGILAQSIGGGGGFGVMGTDSSGWDPVGSFLRSITGGSDAASGDGGVVSVVNTGAIATAGAEAHGIVAQSVGAGGGVSLSVESDPADLLALEGKIGADDKAMLKTAGYDLDAHIADVKSYLATRGTAGGSITKQLGGDNARGQGGAVGVEHRGAIATTGAGAIGILAQSIGGGGGLLSNGAGSTAIVTTLGGANGAVGDGAGVTVSLRDAATITTGGSGAHAILAQSIGGGGGYAGIASSLTTAISAGDRGGSGGAVDVEVAQGTSIRTSGIAAHGIFAQSLGGGGGAGFDLTSGTIAPDAGAMSGTGVGGLVSIDVAGTVAASGLNAYGILAQSGAQTGNGLIAPDNSRRGAIDVTVSGRVTGGTGTGAAVRMDGAQQARLTIAEGGVLDSLNGRTVIGSYAPDAVFNRGTIVGDVHLGGSDVVDLPDSFDNGADGATRAIVRTRNGGIVFVGANGLFRNAGTLDIGGVGTLAQTTLTGSFEQTDSGRMIVDVRPMAREGALRSDLLVLSEAGASVRLGGTIQPHLVGGLLPGEFTFLTGGTEESVSATARATTIQSGSVAVNWTIVQKGNSLALSPRADFANPRGAALTPNQREVAGALQQAWDKGSIAQADVFGRFLTVSSHGGYVAALDDVHNKSSLHSVMGRVGDTRAGLRRAMSCPAFAGTTLLLREGECVWSRFGAERSTMRTTAEEEGYRQKAYGLQLGAQKEVAPDWFVGFSGAYTDAEQDTADRLSGSTSDAGDVSLAVKHQAGPWLFALSTNLGYAWQRNSRSIVIGDTTARAESRQRVFSAGGRLRVSYQQPLGGWYVRPYADVDLLYTHSPSYSERGAEGLNLDVRSLSKTLLGVSPNLELGGRVNLGGGRWMRPFATVGGAFFSDDHFTGRASLQGDATLDAFATTSRIPDALAEAGGGVQFWLGQGVELLGEYQGRRGEHFRSHAGTVRLSIRF